MKALVHNLVPSIAATLSKSDISFKCFSEIDKLYIDGVVLNDENHQENSQKLFLSNIMKQVVNAGQTLLKYEIPAVIKSTLGFPLYVLSTILKLLILSN